jgi:hypothetical protein
MKTALVVLKFFAVVGLLALAPGCASTRQAEQAEQMLAQAGFTPVAARSERQVKHLQTLPVDRLTVVKLNGKTIYVFPDPAHHQIYVGNLQEYQNYRLILSDNKVEEQSRVMAALEEDGNDQANWADWSNNSGWTYGDN